MAQISQIGHAVDYGFFYGVALFLVVATLGYRAAAGLVGFV